MTEGPRGASGAVAGYRVRSDSRRRKSGLPRHAEYLWTRPGAEGRRWLDLGLPPYRRARSWQVFPDGRETRRLRAGAEGRFFAHAKVGL
jgi:hypothetical protein